MTDTLLGNPEDELSEYQSGTPAQADYFGFSSSARWFFPDKVSWLDLKVLNEGERRKYLNETNREVKLAKGSGDAHVKMRPGDDKHALLKTAIVGWNLQRAGTPVPFTPQTLDQFLQMADPRVVDLIDKQVRKMNPWLLSEMSVEDIDREIADLQEMRATKIAEEEGNGTSSNK